MLDYANLFSPNKYEKNDKIILKYFQLLKRLWRKNYTALFAVSIQKKTKSKTLKILKTKNGRIMLLPKCEVCDSIKSRFIKEQDTGGL